MLLNFSNHPSEKWSAKQRETAESEYSKIVDMPFPNIPPDMSSHKVQEVAENFYRTIANISEPKHLTIHIMGEMTFVYKIVQLFQRSGFTCIASTSERKTIDNADGTKTVLFEFVRFRSY